MSGHSQFKNIMHRKGAQDAKRAKVFTKIIRELTTAARGGLPDPDLNPRLRAAIAAARIANMSKETLDRAIKRGAGGGEDGNFEEMRYEGYGPGGVAIIVEALTDNRNRTASEIRGAFSKHGGSLGETNSVSFMFERQGLLRFPTAAGSPDAVFEAAIEVGADNVESDDGGHEITCPPDAFAAVREALETRLGAPTEARLAWRPKSNVPVDAGTAEPLFKLLEMLEDSDDVQTVAANFEVADDVLSRLAG
jgi:YebC/PmpR family DNA-binding regulatory protein